MAERAVDAVARHIASALPVFVSVVPSLVCAFVFGAAVLVVGGLIVWDEYKRGRKASHFEERTRWVIVLCLTCITAQMSFMWTQRFVYQCMSIRVNTQHYANIVWGQRYRAALA